MLIAQVVRAEWAGSAGLQKIKVKYQVPTLPPGLRCDNAEVEMPSLN